MTKGAQPLIDLLVVDEQVRVQGGPDRLTPEELVADVVRIWLLGLS